MRATLESPPASVTQTRVTPEQLLSMPDSKNFELVNGKLVERNIGWTSAFYASNLLGLLGAYCREHDYGWLTGSNAGYRCYERICPEDPERVRKPNVSFIALNRMSQETIPVAYCELAPDLAVEVTSPHDRYSEVEEKVDEYLRAGVRLVWVVRPSNKSIRIHRANGTIQDLRVTDELGGEDVIPGFRCPVSEVFRLPGKSGDE